MDYAQSGEMISVSQCTSLMFRNVLMQISLKEEKIKTLVEFQNNFHKNNSFHLVFNTTDAKME